MRVETCLPNGFRGVLGYRIVYTRYYYVDIPADSRYTDGML